MTDPAWMLRAACRGMDPTLFFPAQGEADREAYAVCNGQPGVSGPCPVKAECLEYALGSFDQFGIFGGTSEKTRKRLRSQRYRAQRQDPILAELRAKRRWVS